LLKPKPPLAQEQLDWADRSFQRLGAVLGAHRLLDATVMLPTQECFPDRYDKSEKSLRRMVDRVAEAMMVDPTCIDVELFSSDYDVAKMLVPHFSGRDTSPGGLYFHLPEERQRWSLGDWVTNTANSLDMNCSSGANKTLQNPEAIRALIAESVPFWTVILPQEC